jgi:hypothetical protein
MSVHAELVVTLEQLRCDLEELAIRGLRAVGGRQRDRLRQMREDLAGSGVAHLAGAIGKLEEALAQDDPAAGAVLFRTQTALRVFERLLTLEVVQQELAVLVDSADSEPTDSDAGGTAADLASEVEA